MERDQALDLVERSRTSGRSTARSTCAAPTTTIARSGDGTALSAPPPPALRRLRLRSAPPPHGWSAVATSTSASGGGVSLQRDGRLTWRALPQLEIELVSDRQLRSGQPRYVVHGPPPSPRHRRHISSARRPPTAWARRCAPPTRSRRSCRCSSTRSCSWRACDYGPFFTSGAEDRRARPHSPTAGRRRAGAAGDPDTEQATLNVNVVLRWEYRLGSTLFVVYTRAQNPALRPPPGGATFRLRPLLHGRAAENVPWSSSPTGGAEPARGPRQSCGAPQRNRPTPARRVTWARGARGSAAGGWHIGAISHSSGFTNTIDQNHGGSP